MAITNGYATLAQLREHLGDTGTTLTAAVAERAIEAASRAIDRHCGRKFWLDAAVAVRVYRPDDAYVAWVDDIGTTTGLVIKTDTTGDGGYATTWASTDYQIEPLNADVVAAGDTVTPYAWWRIVAIDRYTFPRATRRHTLQVTARFGWSAIPDDVEQACLLKAAALYERRNSVQGVAGFNGFGEVRISRFEDPDVAALVGPYVRHTVRAV
ncbi:MAG TPA: hypothetical protein VFM54_23345 [Micromonosporaceae bacterium]|nr:hypothetical protein [Micromonosporaceae bacterium]